MVSLFFFNPSKMVFLVIGMSPRVVLKYEINEFNIFNPFNDFNNRHTSFEINLFKLEIR